MCYRSARIVGAMQHYYCTTPHRPHLLCPPFLTYLHWACSTQNHLPPRAQELGADRGAQTWLIPQPHDSAEASPGTDSTASISNGIHQRTSINGARTSNALMELSSALLKLGVHVGTLSRARCSVHHGFSSVRAEALVALRNTKKRLTERAGRASALRGAAPAM